MSVLSTLRGVGVISIALAISPAALANRYSISDLGYGNYPVGVNLVGVVAGNVRDRQIRGEVFRGGEWHYLQAHTAATAINRAGNVVGINLLSEPVFLPHNADPIVMQLPGGVSGESTDLNNSDVAVGWYIANDGTNQCFSWTPSGGGVNFGEAEGFPGCEAMAINDQNQITGQAILGIGRLHAYFWSQGVFTDIGALPGNDSSNGLSINESGVVVGAGYDDAGSIAFKWDGKSISSLDPSRKFAVSVATSVNDSGAIVGWAQKNPSSGTVAVRFAHGEILQLNNEVTNLGGWDLQKAIAINGKGVIVGTGALNGVSHAFMLTPL